MMRIRCIAVVCLHFVVTILAWPGISRAQTTTTCPQGQWDMADVVMMDQSLRNANYHLEGTATTPSDPTGTKSYLAESIPNTNNNTTGKLQYVKTYQTVSGLSGTYGYPWDINLYDQNFVYLWVTEQTWSEPWAYKKFNSGSNDYSMQLTRRCVLPGDGDTSLIIVPPPSVNPSHNTQYTTQPTKPTNSSADCTAASSTSDLKYARMEVQAPQSSFLFHDDVHGTQGNITVVPVYYDYACLTGNGTNGDCKYREIFTYNNTYGWIRWDYYKWDATKGMWSWQKTSLHDHLKPDDGHRGVYFPCF
jgi:hypothetical protein